MPDPREIPGDRPAGETSDVPTPEPAADPDPVDTAPVLQDRRKPK
jgi:hypothetical protein